MKAYVIQEYGDPDVFERREIDKPDPGPNEVRVRVHATSVNPLDAKVRRQGDEMGLDVPMVLGYDISGVVDEVGPGVERFGPGDDVFYTPALFEQGSYAEYHVENEDLIAMKPPSLSHVEAASLPVVACTAWEAIVERLDVRLGETVLVQGGGGVGMQAVQMAAKAGAQVFVTGNANSQETLERLGAERAIDYRTENVTSVLSEYETDVDAVLDAVGGAITESLSVVGSHARLVDLVGTSADIGGAAKSKNARVDFMALTREHAKLDAVATLVERGELEAVIDSVLTLDEVAEGHRRIEAGGLEGKIVLDVADE